MLAGSIPWGFAGPLPNVCPVSDRLALAVAALCGTSVASGWLSWVCVVGRAEGVRSA